MQFLKIIRAGKVKLKGLTIKVFIFASLTKLKNNFKLYGILRV